MELTTTQQPQMQLFDYDQLEAIHRDAIRRATEEIRHFTKVAATACIRIGERLTDVHRRMPSVSIYEKYLQAEFGWSLSQHYNFTRVYQQFGKSENIENIAPSALYLLAAPGTPEEARKAALQFAADGQHVSHQLAKDIVTQTKEAEEAALGSLFVAGETPTPEAETGQGPSAIVEPSAEVELCLCGHTYEQHDEATDCKECTCECYETEAVERPNVESLVEQTETVTTKTVIETAPVVTLLPPVAIQGEGDILFEKATIQINLTIYPLASGDRNVLISHRANDDAPIFAMPMPKYSQLSGALENNFALNDVLLAIKRDLLAKAEAKNIVTTNKPATNSVTSAKTTKTTTTAKKGKK